jgi:DNA repair exonuclease SbcCD ATPase subunit
MSDQQTILNRIGRLFKRSKSNGDLDNSSDNNPGDTTISVSRPTLVKPWGRNQAAISQLQSGFQTLTELITAIRENMEHQNNRQEALLQHLSALPKVLETLPESNRLQGQTLKAIQDQLTQQADQQHTLGEILLKLSDTGSEQKDILEGLRDRVETLNQQDRAMADSLNNVGTALESASRNSATSTQVLVQMRENLNTRDTQLENVLHRQGNRLTTMLTIAISLSAAALVAVVIMGFLMIRAR